VCCDINPQGRPHVIGDGFQLPFKDDAFDEIVSVHVLEHLGRHHWPLMLSEMYRTLEPGGRCYIEVPDFVQQCRDYLHAIDRGSRGGQHLIRTGIWGKTERMGMGHQFGFDQALLRRAMNKAGFDRVTFLTEPEDQISEHHADGAVLLVRGTKTPSVEPPKDIKSLSFDDLRAYIIQ
jgi:predicted SAM-dependent methyltransferase